MCETKLEKGSHTEHIPHCSADITPQNVCINKTEVFLLFHFCSISKSPRRWMQMLV